MSGGPLPTVCRGITATGRFRSGGTGRTVARRRHANAALLADDVHRGARGAGERLGFAHTATTRRHNRRTGELSDELDAE